MEQRKQLEELNAETLKKLEEYMRTKQMKDEHKQQIKTAQDKWQASWNEFLEALLVLERLEI